MQPTACNTFSTIFDKVTCDMSSGSDFKSQVLAATDIVELISENVALKRRGKDYVGLCPFHQEKTPSFHVSPSRQFFHCYGCKEGGNAIDYVIKRDRVEFLDALRLLGERAGLEMPKFGVSRQKVSERQQLLDAHSAACAFFEKLLTLPGNGEKARAYLEQRGFSDESIQRFQIGVAQDAWDGLLSSPQMRKFNRELLAVAGLVKRRENGSGYYDTFRNRLMFPIRDENGRVIAFGGRVLPGSEDPAKYLNSPETPLFSKSRSVFGLDLARQRIVETRTVVIVEGYTDVVMAHQYGVTNVVSILGTALTEQHVKVLQRFADRIVLLFDADTAGDKAVDKAVDLFLTQPIEIHIAGMPAGVDPDEFLVREGAEAFEKVVSSATDALTYKWRQLDRRYRGEGGDLTGQQKAVGEYLEVLANARGSGPVDALRWGAALTRVSRLTEIPVEELHRRFSVRKAAPARGHEPAVAPAAEPAAAGSTRATTWAMPGPRQMWTAQDRAESWLLGVLLIEPKRWYDAQMVVGLEDIEQPARRALAEAYWRHQRDEGEPVFNEFLATLEDPQLKQLAVELVEEAESLADPEQVLQSALGHFAEVQRRREERKLVAELRRSKEQQPQDAAGATAADEEVLLLKKLSEKAKQPDLRRVV